MSGRRLDKNHVGVLLNWHRSQRSDAFCQLLGVVVIFTQAFDIIFQGIESTSCQHTSLAGTATE